MAKGNNVTFKKVTLRNGNDVWTIFGGTVSHLSVISCRWLNYGIGGAINHDSSELYIIGKHAVIKNNVFEAAGVGVRTAIEVHDSGKTVTGNIVRNYYCGI